MVCIAFRTTGCAAAQTHSGLAAGAYASESIAVGIGAALFKFRGEGDTVEGSRLYLAAHAARYLAVFCQLIETIVALQELLCTAGAVGQGGASGTDLNGLRLTAFVAAACSQGNYKGGHHQLVEG